MKQISLLKGTMLCLKYPKLDSSQRKAIHATRLKEIVTWAKENSPFYKELYQDIGDNFSLTDLPPVDKLKLMGHFDEWTTDSKVRLDDIKTFMENPDNVGRKFMGKYFIYTTSGSTGNPLVTICDETTSNIMGAINILRAFARKKDMKAFILRGGKTIGVFATGGFYLGNSNIRSRLLKMPWKKRKMAITSALLPIKQIVMKLNEFQPSMLGGYPSNLELLIAEQESGRLRISPVIIMTGGEHLSEKLRSRLSQAFGCYVQTNYSCTEGGTVSCECINKHFHINEDWLIVEPVDKNNNPVADGVQSDKILLTNLFNYTQPYIRYEVTDRVTLHHEDCGCGNPFSWLTLEGRSDDVVEFNQDGKIVRIPPLALYATLKEVHSVRRFQLLAYSENKLELRLEPIDGIDRETAFVHTKEALSAYLHSHKLIKFSILLSDDLPKQHSKSGKFKHIICITK
jgi:phenylacetate-coenzyme A ligase PaaK-like adenylate-forming protein